MSITTKTIGNLKDYRFFIPAYQRGYRWSEDEVNALLDDVYEFSAQGNKSYCIQPLIVKCRKDGSYEVVDGQQRLTTIYIFMKIASEEIRSAVPPFDLKYETRSGDADVLQSLSSNTQSDKSQDINTYHITTAYETINNWLNRQQDKSVAIQELNTKIRSKVYFIWYEIPSEIDPISMFTKVNLGKIPLTNAELIKALLLNKDNFNKDIDKRQKEISIAWDKVEQGLRDDAFWYFLNENEQSGTRIDMLFELLADEYNSKFQIHENQTYYPFYVFLATMNAAPNKEKLAKKLWDDVEDLYDEFRDWFIDLNKYHIIGYLISSGVKLAEIYSLTRGKRKSDIIQALLEKAKLVTGKYNLSTISYEKTSDHNKIRKILLLFNIASLVCKSEKQYRFPFDIYKGETGERIKWNIEHIHATADDTDDADDSIGNLTLLDSKTNQTYKDAPFEEKRKIIIERDSRGLFVPLCTKNVFLKVYSNNLDDMSIWRNEDKASYIKAMEKTLKNFFERRF